MRDYAFVVAAQLKQVDVRRSHQERADVPQMR